ncbi:MAG: hypothetical protein WC854_14010, partial [Bacteroidales bacterium]
MKNIFKISLLLILILIVSACSKENLTLDPQTSLGELNAFDNKDRVVGQVNGLYASVKNGGFLG